MPQITDWIAQTYESNSAPLNASRCVNMFAETQVQDAKSKSPVAIWGAPGTSPFAVCGTGPVLGFTVMNSLIYAVCVDSFWQVNPDGSSTMLGTTAPSPNGISIDNNGTTIVWTDGFSGWSWNASSGVRQITDVNFHAGYSVAFFDTYFVFSWRGTRQFTLSPQNWNGTTAFDATQQATKEATSDLLVSIINSHEQLYLMGEKRIEVWYDAGNPPPTFPFQRSDGAIIQRGIIAPYGTCVEDNTLFFLGDDLVFYRLDGFIPRRISNHGVEAQWQKYTDLAHTRCFVFTLMGHKMIALTFSRNKATWVHDLATGRWHERESWLGTNLDKSIGRWRVNCAINNSSSIQGYPDLLFGDSVSGRIDQANMNVFTEYGNTMRALIVGPPVHTDRRRVFMKRFEIDVESGVGLPGGGTIPEEYCAQGIEMILPTEIVTAGALTNTPATFSTFIFSDFVWLPDDGVNINGQWFSNQTNDAGPPSPGLQIGIFNDQSSHANFQIVVNAYDASSNPIVKANYAWTVWTHWVWVGISMNTATQVLQVWINPATSDLQLVPASIVWSSTNPIPNISGAAWHLIPAHGP